jgi:hypothetical protein
MNRQQLQDYARFGAEARPAAIDAERAELLEMFPELRDGSRREAGASPGGRKRRGMSPAQRKAVGDRMRAYWAKRRARRVGPAR